MAGFGGAVKLTGESEYKRALKQIEQSLREVASEMKVVSSAYDKNDKSQQAVSAKMDVLNRKMTEQVNRLNTLKAQYASMNAEYTKNSSAHDKLVATYQSEKAKLDEIGRTLGTTSQEYKDQEKKVAELAQEVEKSAKAQDQNAQSMSKMRVEMNNAQTDINKTKKEIDELGTESSDTAKDVDKLGAEAEESGKQAEQAGNGGFTVLKGVIANLASQAIQMALNGLKQLGGALVNMGKQAYSNFAEFQQLEGGIQTIFGTRGIETVEDYADRFGLSMEQATHEFYIHTQASERLMNSAQNAWKTTGLSVNEYMEQVTGFSATLLQSMGDDTLGAVKYADMAMQDMADNANKMGTDMQAIQNAYQGFAKDNYTMLDNLKLGYGGTAGEMARLINDTGVLGEGIEITAKEVKDVPFDRIIEAIHITQEQIGITGTTVQEANSTIQGSTRQMASAWQNLLTNMANDDADFGQLIDDFVYGLDKMLENMLPRIQQIIIGMGQLVGSLVQKIVPKLVETIPPLLVQTAPILIDAVRNIITSIAGVLPELINAVVELIPMVAQTIVELSPLLLDSGIQMLNSITDGITEALPTLLDYLPVLVESTCDVLVKNLPQIIQTAMRFIVALIQGLSKALPQLVRYIPTIIGEIVGVIIANLPVFVDAAIQIILALVAGLIEATPSIISSIGTIIAKAVQTFIQNLPQFLSTGKQMLENVVKGVNEVGSRVSQVFKDIVSKGVSALNSMIPNFGTVGRNIIQGIWNGISSGSSWLMSQVRQVARNVLNSMKSALGIHSPSTLFRDEVGKNLALGIGEGFSDGMDDVARDMQDAIPTSFDVNSSVHGNGMVEAFIEALSRVKIELDDEVAGRFVDRTVTRLIYT